MSCSVADWHDELSLSVSIFLLFQNGGISKITIVGLHRTAHVADEHWERITESISLDPIKPQVHYGHRHLISPPVLPPITSTPSPTLGASGQTTAIRDSRSNQKKKKSRISNGGQQGQSQNQQEEVLRADEPVELDENPVL
jgi:hypothetical protein